MNKGKDILLVVCSNLFTLFVGIILGFITPKLLSITEYADYKTYTLYLSFYHIFHFGLIDGIVIKYASYSSDDIKNTNLNFLFLFQGVLLVIISTVLLIINNVFNSSYIFTIIIFSLFPMIMLGFVTQLYRINMKFKMFTLSSLLTRISLCFIVLFIYLRLCTYKTLMTYVIFLDFILLLIGIWNYRRMLFRKMAIREGLKEYCQLIIIGIPSVLALFVSTLASGLDRIFINLNNSKEDFAFYSFAFSIIGVVMGVITSVSSVILPLLARVNNEMKIQVYRCLTKFINIFAVITSLGVVFIPRVIELVIPKYANSSVILIIIYPIIIYTVQYSMKQRQYFFLFQKSYLNLLLNICFLVIVLLLNVIVLVLELPYQYYAIATLISYIIWNFIIETIFNKKYSFNIQSDVLFGLLSSTVLLLYSFNFDNIINSIMYILVMILLLFIFYYKFILLILKAIKNKDINIVIK